MRAHVGAVQIACRPRMDDAPAIHHRDIVGKLAGKIEILFDKQNGDACLVAKEADRTADILDDRRLDAFRGLVEEKKGAAA